MEYNDLSWSEETTIEECVASRDLTFPKLIMITSGFHDNSFERTFDNNQIIWISGMFTQNRILGYDSQKCGISLPVKSMLTFTSNKSFPQPNYLFDILQQEKLPIKVSLSESSRDVFSYSNIENVPERLSRIKLKTTSTATFFYGVPLQETMPDFSDMITLPPYLNLTFKVALCFKKRHMHLEVYLSQLEIRFNDYARPDEKILQDVVFQEHQEVGNQSNTNTEIVSLKKINVKKMMYTRPPLPLPKPKIREGLKVIPPLSIKDEQQHSNVYSILPIKESPKELPSKNTSNERYSPKKVKTLSQMELSSRLATTPILPPRLHIKKSQTCNNDIQPNIEPENPGTKDKRNNEDPFDVHDLSIDELAFYLEKLGLQNYIPVFQKEKIDGMILKSLNKEIMEKELGMKIIEALRLLNFIQCGHIPV